jgi:AraC-like DNA-binding protein
LLLRLTSIGVLAPSRPTLAFIPAQPYERLIDVLAERGHDLGADMFARGAGYLSLPSVEALVGRACTLAPEFELGLEVGSRISLMSHGWLSVAALSAATIADAIDVVAQHFALVSPLFSMSVDGNAVRLSSRFALAPEVERFHTAVLCGSLHAHVPRLLFGGALPSGLELDAAHPRPRSLPRWVDEIGVTLAFDRPHHELRLPSALLSVRLPLADARAHRAALRRCGARLASRPDPSNTAATVRRVLITNGPPFLDLAGTAKRLATSSRSLRRRLRDEGTSFRSLLDEVRGALADEWLEDPRRSITEIGLDLGYTDAANFARAYRRTKGVSPSAARKQRLGFSASA